MKFLEIARKFAYLPLIIVLIVDLWAISQYTSYFNQRDASVDIKYLLVFNGVIIFITFIFAVIFFIVKQVKAGVINLVSMFISIAIGIVTLFVVGLSVCSHK